MRANTITIAALAVAAGLSLTACQSDDDAAGRSNLPAASASTPSGNHAEPDGSARSAATYSAAKNPGRARGTIAATGSSANAEAGKCRTDGLDITARDSTIDGDPEGSVAVEFTNTGGRDCTLSGYAGVDLTTNAGTLSAKRTGQPAEPTLLKKGKSVAFTITYPVNDSGGSGIRITGLVVTPPDETTSVSLKWPGAATLPVTDGSGSPVRVGPIGSAGQGG
ncbi:DUF4232 domain-containing protein [Streptomyces sp. NPDC006193]|uniref:DUF4232 domain-containing protein n=1 Tax=Streptomyces sp. NPDC006193 TaxID=3155717 RepID=UPI0033B02A72